MNNQTHHDSIQSRASSTYGTGRWEGWEGAILVGVDRQKIIWGRDESGVTLPWTGTPRAGTVSFACPLESCESPRRPWLARRWSSGGRGQPISRFYLCWLVLIAGVRACVRVCLRACLRACLCVRACVCVCVASTAPAIGIYRVFLLSLLGETWRLIAWPRGLAVVSRSYLALIGNYAKQRQNQTHDQLIEWRRLRINSSTTVTAT